MNIYDLLQLSFCNSSIHKFIKHNTYYRSKINCYLLYENIFIKDCNISDRRNIYHSKYDILNPDLNNYNDIIFNKYIDCVKNIYFIYHPELEKLCKDYNILFDFDDIENKLSKFSTKNMDT
jgi:hypothetical protein